LNQDLLLEIHYRNSDAALWYGTRWQGWEMPGLRAMPLADPLDRAAAKWRPEEPFLSNPNMQPYYKLHGSIGWEATDGQRLLVVGRDKTGIIARHPILHWSYQRLEEYLRHRSTRLMVIGYGFGDDHINQTLIDAHQAGTLSLMYLVHPSGKAILNKYPPGSIPGPQPLLDIVCIECTVPISTAFNGDDMAREQMERIFA
jgi:SIR2-like protein